VKRKVATLVATGVRPKASRSSGNLGYDLP